jgi:predicted ATPase
MAGMIDRVFLRNFKCFERLELPMAPLTVLAGLNGSGKSSVLQALLILRQSHLLGALGRCELALNGPYVKLGTARDVFFQHAADDNLGVGLSVVPELDETLPEGAPSSRVEWTLTYDDLADRLLPGDEEEWPHAVVGALFGGQFQYLEAERVGPRTFFSVPERAAGESGELGTKGEFTASFLARCGEEKVTNVKLLHPTERRPALFRQVEAWIGEISPGARLTVLPHSRMDVVQLQYSYPAGRMMTTELRPTNVGFGLTYGLPILVALLASSPGALLLIENPEAHLHPRGQVQMGRLLARAAHGGVQVVVETHSDHVLNGIRIAVRDHDLSPREVAFHFFERGAASSDGSAQVVSPTVDSDGRIDQWPAGFFDEYMKVSLELLRPR